MKVVRLKKLFALGLIILCIRLPYSSSSSTWDEWVDYVVGDIDSITSLPETLNMEKIGEMRVRDIKRRLSRTHGYSADELARMLDKKELINALAFEEHKTRQLQQGHQKRYLVKRSIIAALVAVAVVLCWPLLSHALEVAMVNFVVYTDRKQHEAKRCWELKSGLGFVGIILMFFMDILQIWLSFSILLSWVTTSKYLFPLPRLPINPAQLLGGEVARGPLSRYGLNIAPMAVSWALRFTNSTIEAWTGRALAKAQREMKQKQRANETQQEREERRARKASRKAAKQAAKEQAPPSHSVPVSQTGHMSATVNDGDPDFPPKKERTVIETISVREFLQDEFENPTIDTEPEPSALDDLD